MLKNTFKRVLAVATASTIVMGMMIIPAKAGTMALAITPDVVINNATQAVPGYKVTTEIPATKTVDLSSAYDQANASINVNFDYKYTATAGELYFYLNDDAITTLTTKKVSGYGWENPYANKHLTPQMYVGTASAKTVANLGYTTYFDGNKVMTAGNTYNIDMTVKLSDAAYDNDQTVTIVVKNPDGSELTKSIGLLDANATNGTTADGTYDKYTSFSSLHIWQGKGEADAEITNLKATVNHGVNRFNSSLSDTTFLDEKFNSLTTPTNASAWNEKTLSGVDNAVFKTCSTTNDIITAETVSGRGNVLKMTGTSKGTVFYVAITPTTSISDLAGKEVVIEYDYYMPDSTSQMSVHLNTKACFEYIYGTGGAMNPGASKELLVFKNGAVIPANANYIQDPCNLTPEKWYNVQIILKDADPEYKSQPTMSYIVTDIETNTVMAKTVGYIDFDYTDTKDSNGNYKTDGERSPLTTLNKVIVGHIGWANKSPVNGSIDDLTITVKDNDFVEILDVDDNNGMKFEPGETFELNYSANMSYAKDNNYKVVIAQYSGKRLISATTSTATRRGKVSVTADSNADEIKAMIWNMDTIIPTISVFTLTAN